jgi:uncharacterized protein YjaZ
MLFYEIIILDWCIDKFGQSKYYNSSPKLRVYQTDGHSYSDKNKAGNCGHYDFKGLLTIFLGSNDSIIELCDTVLHEYKHYLMSIREYDKLTKELIKAGCNKKKAAAKHPHEKRAVCFAKKWSPICYEELKYKLESTR